MQKSRFLFEPRYALEPNKLVIYNEVSYLNSQDGNYYSRHDLPKDVTMKRLKPTHTSIKRQFHNFLLSDNAYRTLRKKINWLYYLSKPREITTYSGKKIYNFRCCFLTLTLPSKQVHRTAFITKNLLNQFLTEIKQRVKMTNYIWRLEFQNNGNVHYHLITDSYIDYHLVTKIWNRICAYHGYIQPFTDKMQALSLSDYVKKYNRQGKTDYSILAKRYAKGKREGWKNPNSCDCRSVVNSKAVAYYLSKYFGKSSQIKTACNELDNADNSKSLRLWYCSRSLSKMKSITGYLNDTGTNLISLVSWSHKCVKKVMNYATCYYYEVATMVGQHRKWLEFLLKQQAKACNYQPCLSNSS